MGNFKYYDELLKRVFEIIYKNDCYDKIIIDICKKNDFYILDFLLSFSNYNKILENNLSIVKDVGKESFINSLNRFYFGVKNNFNQISGLLRLTSFEHTKLCIIFNI